MKTYQNTNVDALKGKKIVIVGYGSQGRAQAQNLHDSGCDVTIGLRAGSPSAEKARADGLSVARLEDAIATADVVALLTPDETHQQIYQAILAEKMRAQTCLLFAHGFSILYQQVMPRDDIDVVLVAPKGVGPMVREKFVAGSGVAALIGIEQNVSGNADAIAVAYASANGCEHTGIFASTFKEETEVDLFSEQAVLCGGVIELVKVSFDTLTEAGYAPEVAYFECLHELKLIVDLLHEGGLAKMHEAISPTAAFGGLVSGERVIDSRVKDNLKAILTDIQSGEFAKAFLADVEQGKKRLNKLTEKQLKHGIEAVEKRFRGV